MELKSNSLLLLAPLPPIQKVYRTQEIIWLNILQSEINTSKELNFYILSRQLYIKAQKAIDSNPTEQTNE
jgi:hypothetical protein